MKLSKLFLLFIVMVGLLPVLVYGGAEESPPQSEGICYKVFYEANFKAIIKLKPFDYTRKYSACIASTVISDISTSNVNVKRLKMLKSVRRLQQKRGLLMMYKIMQKQLLIIVRRCRGFNERICL